MEPWPSSAVYTSCTSDHHFFWKSGTQFQPFCISWSGGQYFWKFPSEHPALPGYGPSLARQEVRHWCRIIPPAIGMHIFLLVELEIQFDTISEIQRCLVFNFPLLNTSFEVWIFSIIERYWFYFLDNNWSLLEMSCIYIYIYIYGQENEAFQVTICVILSKYFC